MKKMSAFFSLMGLVLLTACGSGSGTAKVQFANATGSRSSISAVMNSTLGSSVGVLPFASILSTEAPSVFQMKLIAVYLTEDIDPNSQNNVGMTSMIYLNPDCQDDIMHCDISGGTAEDGAPMSKVISSYFDFAQASADVNAAINAQGRSIEPATYKYARVEFCKYNSQNANNIKWQASGMSSPREFKAGSCTSNSTVFSTPITVAQGDSVTVTLSYDLSNLVSSTAPSYQNDQDPSSGKYFTLPTFEPSATQ